MDNILALHPAALGLILGFPKNFSLMLLRFIDGTAKASGQKLYNVNRTHQVLVSGKQVLQNKNDDDDQTNVDDAPTSFFWFEN